MNTPATKQVTQEIIDCAHNWIAADADKGTSTPKSWKRVIPKLLSFEKAQALSTRRLQDARGVISSLVQQVEQMRGLFPDDDGQIQQSLDDAQAFLRRTRAKGSRPAPHP